MRKIDALAEKKYKIPALILMENAGQALAREAAKITNGKKVAVVCGSGNNAGDGFVAARYLINMGIKVSVILTKPQSSFKGICKANFEILKKLKAEISDNINKIIKAGVVIDALLGTGIKGEVSGNVKNAIELINNSKAFVVSADIPSGIDSDTGAVAGIAVKTDLTVTFALLKKAFKYAYVKEYTGKIIVADIGVPKAAIGEIMK